MACAALHTGQEFLWTTLAHIDCQARTVGAYGYGALADPGSPVAIALTSLLTLFIALLGIRLLLGHPLSGRDVIGEALRVGIVLTLAFSWPAWRTVGYDLVLNGPSEIANTVGLASGLPGSRKDMLARLQDADDAIVAITVFGSGRLTGDVATGTDIGDSPRGIAVSDQFALGAGRSLFLATTIGSVALVRLGAGILLAIAPLMAGLHFFAGTSSLFFGWLRALAFCALGNVMLLITQGAELALLYPWMSDVLAQRGARVFTPSAPTELLVLTMGFGALTTGLLYLTAKLTFLPGSAGRQAAETREPGDRHESYLGRPRITDMHINDQAPARALLIAEAVTQAMRREEQSGSPSRTPVVAMRTESAATTPAGAVQGVIVGQSETLGTSFRRSHRRSSAAADKRNSKR